MDVETCGHPACSCAVTDRKYCSTHCEQAAKDVASHDTCDCGHPDCAD